MQGEFKFRALTIEDWKDIDTEEFTGKDGLTLKEDRKDGQYISEPLDSGAQGCRWHRIRLEADIPVNSTLAVSFYTAETAEDAKSWSGKRIFTAATDAPKDALVEVPQGRYITLKLDFHSEGHDSPVLKLVKIYYPALSYLRYLPAIYQKDKKETSGQENESRDFLPRFLSIFESALYDSEEMISRIPMYFDPSAAPEEFYRWLAGWLSLDLYDLLDEDKKREFILRAVEFYKQKGTLSGIASIVSFLTGKNCCVKEYMNNVFRSYGMEHPEEQGIAIERECRRFYRKTSLTVNTKDPDLISNIGTYKDEVHYTHTVDPSDRGLYSPHVIGLFVFISSREKLIVEPTQLKKIIDSFLPVFVRAVIIPVQEIDELYYINDIIDEYYDNIHEIVEEQFKDVSGVYMDETDWNWLHAYGDSRNGLTNDLGFRTPHNRLGVWRQL